MPKGCTAMISHKFITALVFVSFFFLGFIFQSYLLSITVGALLAIATRPLYNTIYKRINFAYKKAFVSTLLTLLLFLVVFLPLIYFVGISYKYIPKIAPDEIMDYLQNIIAYLKHLPQPFDIFQDSINALLGEFNLKSVDMQTIRSLLNNVTQLFFKVNSVVYQFFLILFFYFLFNFYGLKLFMFISRLLPMVKSFKRILFNELRSTLSSVFFGSIFSMILQGIAFGFFISLFSEYDPFYLGMATGFMTAIPVVGTYIVALPLAVIELLNGEYLFAFMTLLFALVVLSGIIDSYLRLLFMKFLHKKYSLSYSSGELFILLSMIAGVGVFGGWGLIIAPAILSLCVAVFRIYKKRGVAKKYVRGADEKVSASRYEI